MNIIAEGKHLMYSPSEIDDVFNVVTTSLHTFLENVSTLKKKNFVNRRLAPWFNTELQL